MGSSDRDAKGHKAKGKKGKKGKKGRTAGDVKLSEAKKIAAETVAKGKAAKEARKAAEKAARGSAPADFVTALRAGDGFVLADVDPESTPGYDGDKAAAAELMAGLAAQVGELQERLYAESKEGGRRAILLVVQGMDTSGKGGIMRHVVGAVDPQGVDIASFKAPTAEERAHDFLWRIRRALPQPGEIGVFDRSHYEDVLIVRVHDLVPEEEWSGRYALINEFEESVASSGTTIVKVMLHISKEEQKGRLTERLERPDKHWKYNPGDVDERARWDDYMQAYQAAIEQCSTAVAPWHVVPANRKWYAQLAVMNLLLAALQGLAPTWPAADFDVAAEKARLAQS